MVEKSDTAQAPEVTESFAAQVWNTLSRVDVGDNIETKGDKYKLSFLSWTWAWSQLMSNYPQSSFTALPETVYDDGTVMVRVCVEVIANDAPDSYTGAPSLRPMGCAYLRREMHLPVMDHKNNAVPNPSARQRSDAIARCLVKCIALFGLGLDVYAGSDIPVGTIDDPISDDQLDVITGLLVKSDCDITDPESESLVRFLKWAGAESLAEIPRKRYKEALSMLETKIRRMS